MDAPVAAEVETKSEKSDETERAKSYECGLCDTEIVYKIAQELLPGLASSCVDNTTGGIFTSAGSVAVDMRKEMADYLTQRSETYVAEFLLSENSSGSEISEHPFDIIINLIDDFSASKRNMFSRVSEWVLSDRREDRIDDFVQEMDINGFWLLGRREYVASVLLKNVDYKNAFHCNMVCSTEDEIVKHRLECKFRPMDCTNEGCTTRYCAAQKEHHEAVCPFMILPCEQKCSDYVMRREMDRHCVTICPMKLVNCSFYTVGCKSSIPRCNVQQHNADDLSSHLLYILRTAHKEASDDDLKHRVEQIRSLSTIDKLARARDARALTYLIKDAEAKLGPLEAKAKPHTESQEDSNKKESPTKTEQVVKDGSNSPMKKEKQPASETRPSTEKPAIKEEDSKLPMEENANSPNKIEESKDKEESFLSPSKEDGGNRESPIKEVSSDSQEKESEGLAAKEQEKRGSPIKGTLEAQSQRDEKETTLSPREVKVDEPVKSPRKETIREASGNKEEGSKKSAKDEKIKQLSSSNEEGAKKSPKKETLKQSSKVGVEESKQLSKKETFRREKESKISPKKETFRRDEELNPTETEHDSFYSDEESMKSPS